MNHDEKWLARIGDDGGDGKGEVMLSLDAVEDACKAYAEHLIHDFLDEREDLKKYIAELEAHINELEGSGFGTK